VWEKEVLANKNDVSFPSQGMYRFSGITSGVVLYTLKV